MSTLAFPGIGAQTATYCGELVTWNRAFKAGQSFQVQTLRNALQQAGLDPATCKPICTADAFRRACRTLADQGVIKCLEDRKDTIAFRYDCVITVADGKTCLVQVSEECVLDKATGVITGPDPVMTARVQSALSAIVDARTVSDVSRLLRELVEKEAGGVLFSFADGVHFLPSSCAPFCARLERFVGLIGGNLRRMPIPDGQQLVSSQAPASAGVVTEIVQDAISLKIGEYEQRITELHKDSSTRAVNAALRSVQDARDLIWRHQQFLTGQEAILEDHIALCEYLITQAKSKEPPTPSVP